MPSMYSTTQILERWHAGDDPALHVSESHFRHLIRAGRIKRPVGSVGGSFVWTPAEVRTAEQALRSLHRSKPAAVAQS